MFIFVPRWSQKEEKQQEKWQCSKNISRTWFNRREMYMNKKNLLSVWTSLTKCSIFLATCGYLLIKCDQKLVQICATVQLSWVLVSIRRYVLVTKYKNQLLISANLTHQLFNCFGYCLWVLKWEQKCGPILIIKFLLVQPYPIDNCFGYLYISNVTKIWSKSGIGFLSVQPYNTKCLIDPDIACEYLSVAKIWSQSDNWLLYIIKKGKLTKNNTITDGGVAPQCTFARLT